MNISYKYAQVIHVQVWLKILLLGTQLSTPPPPSTTPSNTWHFDGFKAPFTHICLWWNGMELRADFSKTICISINYIRSCFIHTKDTLINSVWTYFELQNHTWCTTCIVYVSTAIVELFIFNSRIKHYLVSLRDNLSLQKYYLSIN